MIVSCPDCRSKWRLDRQRHEGKQLTLRCARCRAVFTLRVPREGMPRVIVGHGDSETAKLIGSLLTAAGFRWTLGGNGEDVMALMTKDPPRLVLIDAALPGLPSYLLIEAIRNSEVLGKVKVLLLGTVYNHSAYRAVPQFLHGADDYVDCHRLADDLVGKVRRLVGVSRLERVASDASVL